MLLRRIFEHFKNQNWIAVTLDLIVVVVGIFLAFQLERWYAAGLQERSVYERLLALADDNSANLQILDRQILVRTEQIDAAKALLALDERIDPPVGPEEFYELLGTTTNNLTPRFRRGAYDLLISTGQIDLIELPTLESTLADFYSAVDEFLVYNQGSWTSHRVTYEPFMIDNIDMAAVTKNIHPDDFNDISLSYDPQHFMKIIGNGKFEGVLFKNVTRCSTSGFG